MSQSSGVDKICVVKAGSAVLVNKEGGLDLASIQELCTTLDLAHKRGWRPVLVTSGAVASGRGIYNARAQNDEGGEERREVQKRMFAAMGQASLLSIYKESLARASPALQSAQVLLTKDVFSEPHRYHTLCEALFEMLRCSVLPIINTNDVVHVKELDFTDNDHVASYVAATLGADYLILLTDTEGVFTKNPKVFKDARRVSSLPADDTSWPQIAIDDSRVSAGGMKSKLNAMRMMADFGIPCCITNGKHPDAILDILAGNPKHIGTTLKIEMRRNIPPKLKWMATGSQPEGTLIVSGLGAQAIQRDDKHRASILAIGVEGILGDFQSNSVVVVRDEQGRFLGVGRVRIAAGELSRVSKAPQQVVVRREHFLPMRQGLSFVDERVHLKAVVADFRERYEYFLNKRNGWLTAWERGTGEGGYRFALKDPERINAILLRAEKISPTLDVTRDDWLLYELASYFFQQAPNRP